MEMTAAASSSASTPLPRSDQLSTPTCFIQLWPAYEYTGLLKELSHLLSWGGEGRDEVTRRLCLQDFHMHCSPGAQCHHVCGEQVSQSLVHTVCCKCLRAGVSEFQVVSTVCGWC